ncbi:ATP-binding protein [Anaeromyxobacter oryzisoli]|uniref:ATP-binding protein n=1 Tax=Anaeromyxobacter oryzisoli TaxID=2925408 RepID=UPI001F591EA1|nr:ATP-binding protein [Anaeromyxobacter sp. SG63]
MTTQRAEGAGPAATAGAQSTLLVVDDDEHVRRALRRVLRRSTCRVIDVGDAATALQVLESEPVQVVVSDYRMPGMSGVDLLREVKERWPRVQRVLLTGQADSNAIEEAVNQSEIFRFIWKPWDDGHLLITIQSAMDQYWVVEENARLQRLLAERNAQLERLNRDLDGQLAARSQALVRAAQEWRACFDALGDPLAILRGGGCEVVRANTAFARAAGVPVNALPGLRCDAHAFGALPCPAGRGLARGGALEREITVRDRTWLVRSFPLEEEGVSVVVYKDVTEEREVSRRLFHAEKMSAVGQLAGGVAHEINNPLGGILAFAQLMSREDRSAEDMENLRLIQDAANRAKRIVESLLRFSRRPREEEKGPVELSQAFEDALFLLSSQLKGGRYEVVRRYEPACAHANANQLQQIAVNLLVNALQAMDGEGRVVLTTGAAGPGRVHLSVEDSGPGIEPEIAKRIFEPFFTTKPEGQGTGLGLSICYQIAEEHGGSIRAESGAERGARFVVELPAAPHQKVSEERAV